MPARKPRIIIIIIVHSAHTILLLHDVYAVCVLVVSVALGVCVCRNSQYTVNIKLFYFIIIIIIIRTHRRNVRAHIV